MSLNVYLHADSPPTDPKTGSGIFVRRNGETVEISREEWERSFPGQEPVTLTTDYGVDTEVYSRNITHNLGKMASAADIYEPLWRPDEIGATQAKQLIDPLTEGLARLRADPDRFKEYNPPNGWGNYENLCNFVADYLEACKRYPEAAVSVCR